MSAFNPPMVKSTLAATFTSDSEQKKIEMEWDKKVHSPFSTSWLH